MHNYYFPQHLHTLLCEDEMTLKMKVEKTKFIVQYIRTQMKFRQQEEAEMTIEDNLEVLSHLNM